MKCIYSIIIFFTLLQVSVNAQIIPGFTTDTSIYCVGSIIQFTDTSKDITGQTITDWMWVFGDGEIDSVQNPNHVFTDPGSYNVTLVASHATYTSVPFSKQIIVRDIPVVDFTFSSRPDKPYFMLVFHGTVINADAYPYHFIWYFPGDSTLFEDQDTAVFTFPAKGQHDVIFYAEAGYQCSDTVSKTISVNDSLDVPNIFSPNGDGVNDVFEFRTNGITEYELTIYNRWGAVIYTMTARRPFWDGVSSAGVKMTAGNYYYVLKAMDESAYEKAGVVVIKMAPY